MIEMENAQQKEEKEVVLWWRGRGTWRVWRWWDTGCDGAGAAQRNASPIDGRPRPGTRVGGQPRRETSRSFSSDTWWRELRRRWKLLSVPTCPFPPLFRRLVEELRTNLRRPKKDIFKKICLKKKNVRDVQFHRSLAAFPNLSDDLTKHHEHPWDSANWKGFRSLHKTVERESGPATV